MLEYNKVKSNILMKLVGYQQSTCLRVKMELVVGTYFAFMWILFTYVELFSFMWDWRNCVWKWWFV